MLSALPPSLLTTITSLSYLNLLTFLLGAHLITNVLRVLYRLSPWHPLAKYPGPVMAKATYWYRTYHEIYRGGKMTKELFILHEKYGDVVRFGPNDLHFRTPNAFHQIYSNPRILKDYNMYQCFDVDDASSGIIDPDMVRARRDIIQPFFSKGNIRSLEPFIFAKIDKLCNKIASEYGVPGQELPLDLASAFRCMSLDVITDFAFGKSIDALDSPGFENKFLQTLETSQPACWIFLHFKLVRMLMLNMPKWLANILSPDIVVFKDGLAKQVDNFLRNPRSLDEVPHLTVFHRLLDPTIKDTRLHSARPAQNGKLNQRSLNEEAHALVFAGTDTVGGTLCVGTFYILSNPVVYRRMVEELYAAWPVLSQPPREQDLEQLPYLTAVIKECLRMSNGTVSPAHRVAPKGGVHIDGQYVPGGTIISTAPPFLHRDEAAFPDAYTFNPDRWLAANTSALDRCFVPFSRGPRICLGLNLAWAELYLGFANIYRRFDLELYNTTAKDIEYDAYFVPALHGTVTCKFKPRAI